MWAIYDTNNNGFIDIQEFIKSDGLFNFIKANVINCDENQPPELNKSTLSIWFDYWDLDNSKLLDKDKIVRAIIKTFNLNNNIKNMLKIK